MVSVSQTRTKPNRPSVKLYSARSITFYQSQKSTQIRMVNLSSNRLQVVPCLISTGSVTKATFLSEKFSTKQMRYKYICWVELFTLHYIFLFLHSRLKKGKEKIFQRQFLTSFCVSRQYILKIYWMSTSYKLITAMPWSDLGSES